MKAMMAGIYAAEAARLLWRELTLLAFAATLGVGLAGAGQVGLALGVVALDGLGVALLLVRARGQGGLQLAPRWPRLRAALRASERRICEAKLQKMADAAEDLLSSLAIAPADLRQQLRALELLCSRVVSRSLELSRLAAWRRAHLAALDEHQIGQQLTTRQAQLSGAEDGAVVAKLVEAVDALSSRRALCASHRSALARIEAEIDAAEQALLAGAAHTRHLSSRWRELSAGAGMVADPGAADTRRLLTARVFNLDSALAELS